MPFFKNTLSRRTLLVAAGSAPLLGPTRAGAAAPFVGGNAPPYYRFRHGAFECTVVSDGPLVLPKLTEVLVTAPGEEVERLLTANALPFDRWTGPQNALVVNTGRHLVLFDTGMGDRSQAFGPNSGHLLANLRLAGIDPASIDVVALTHAHIDHCWGLVDKQDRLNFPNAQVAISQADFDFWTQEKLLSDPAARAFVLYTRTNLLPVRDRLLPVRDGSEVVPGITAMATPGHTLGHHSYVIESGGRRLVNLGDVLHHHVLLLRHPEWHNVFDSDREGGAATRRRVIEQMVADGTSLIVYHFPFPGLGTIARDGQHYTWLQASIHEN